MENVGCDKTRMIYQEEIDGKIYTYQMINMGDYVGSSSRPWWATAPACWKLMNMKVQEGEKTVLKYDTLIDDHGDLQRVILDDGAVKRVRFYKPGTNEVDEDALYVGDEKYEYVQGKLNTTEKLPQSSLLKYDTVDDYVNLARTTERTLVKDIQMGRTNR